MSIPRTSPELVTCYVTLSEMQPVCPGHAEGGLGAIHQEVVWPVKPGAQGLKLQGWGKWRSVNIHMDVNFSGRDWEFKRQ